MLKRAKRLFEEDTLGRWFESKYKLPSHHSLYLSQSESEHMVVQYGDVYARREDTQQMLNELHSARGGDMDAQKARNAQRKALISRLNVLNAALDEPLYDDDPLLTEWDRALEAGQTPNFQARP